MDADGIRGHVMNALKADRLGEPYSVEKIVANTGATHAEVIAAMEPMGAMVRANTKNGRVVGYSYKGGKRPGWV